MGRRGAGKGHVPGVGGGSMERLSASGGAGGGWQHWEGLKSCVGNLGIHWGKMGTRGETTLWGDAEGETHRTRWARLLQPTSKRLWQSPRQSAALCAPEDAEGKRLQTPDVPTSNGWQARGGGEGRDSSGRAAPLGLRWLT